MASLANRVPPVAPIETKRTLSPSKLEKAEQCTFDEVSSSRIRAVLERDSPAKLMAKVESMR